jgi:hypothetical protein
MPDELELEPRETLVEQVSLDTVISANLPLVASGPDATLQELRWRDAILRLSTTLLETAAQRRDLSPILLAAFHHALARLLIYGDEADLQALELWLAGHGRGSLAGFGEADDADRRLGIDRRFGQRRLEDRRQGERRLQWGPPASEDFQERRQQSERRSSTDRREHADRRTGIGRRDLDSTHDANLDDTPLPIFQAPAAWNAAAEKLMLGDAAEENKKE